MLQDYNLVAVIQKKNPLDSPLDKLLNDFGKYLEKIRGLQLSTIQRYLWYIREFLKARYSGPLDIHRLNVKDIREFMAGKAMQGKPKTAKSFATSLRAFFKFLWMPNQIEYPLQDAVPTIPYRKLTTIPKYLTDKQLRCLLSCFNLSTPIGLRDRAMAVFMARTGLRSSEIAQLHL